MQHIEIQTYKRPVKQWCVIVLNAVVNLVKRINTVFKEVAAESRVSYSENRIYALNCRLDKIDAALQEECAALDKDQDVIKALVAMKRAACEELADEQAALHQAKQECKTWSCR